MNESIKFKVGYKVEIKRGVNQGCVGTTREVLPSRFNGRQVIGVEFENWREGHSCSGLLRDRESGWRFMEEDVMITNKPLTDFKNI